MTAILESFHRSIDSPFRQLVIVRSLAGWNHEKEENQVIKVHTDRGIPQNPNPSISPDRGMVRDFYENLTRFYPTPLGTWSVSSLTKPRQFDLKPQVEEVEP